MNLNFRIVLIAFMLLGVNGVILGGDGAGQPLGFSILTQRLVSSSPSNARGVPGRQANAPVALIAPQRSLWAEGVLLLLSAGGILLTGLGLEKLCALRDRREAGRDRRKDEFVSEPLTRYDAERLAINLNESANFSHSAYLQYLAALEAQRSEETASRKIRAQYDQDDDDSVDPDVVVTDA